MKLPTENASKGDEQPVAESGGSGASGGPSGEGGAASGHQAPVSSESSSESGANNAPSSTNNQSGGREGGNPDVDFSEYLWMENEEEFDSQVCDWCGGVKSLGMSDWVTNVNWMLYRCCKSWKMKR